MTTEPPHNWTEDYEYGDEGKAKLNCIKCGTQFLGWKLKTICRVCAVPVFPVGIRHITHVAIKYGNHDHSVQYSLPAPSRHSHVIRIIKEDTENPFSFDVQGFLDNEGIFVNRREALDIALKANQIIDINNIRANRLFSEDLW